MDRQKSVAVRKTLDQMGMRHSLKGYCYIISAVEKCLENRNKLNHIVKGLYVEIVAENDDTVSRVERAIRHVIENTWSQGNPNVFNKIFGYTVSANKGKPTNSEFIALVTDFVAFNYEEIAGGTYSFE